MSTSILRLTCPECDSALSLKTAPASGRCKCPKCGAMIATDAASSVAKAPQKADAPSSVVKAPQKMAPPAPKKASPAIQKAPAAKAGAIRQTKAAPKDEPSAAPVKKGGGTTLLLAGGGVLLAGFFLLVLIGGVIGVVWAMSGKKPSTTDTQASRTDTPDTKQPTPPAPPPVDPTPAPVFNPGPAAPGGNSLSPEMLAQIKQATLLIKVTQGNDIEGSGSGFFEKTTGLVITNAHVVGMLGVHDSPPKKIDVVINSGNQGAMTLPGKLLAVDRDSDLALLEVAQAPPNQVKLAVGKAKDLQETQQVFVCGFPLGEKANRNVTINTTTVSSLHLGKDNIVTKIQVNGGMDHGNSGGPVIDTRGTVVGVAFSGYENTALKFAIPGEKVHSLLQGRVSGISVANEAAPRGNQLGVTVTLSTIDPRKRIQRVSVDYWTGPGDQAAPGPSAQAPTLGGGNSQRKSVEAKFDQGSGAWTAELLMDSLPEGNNRLWIQTVVTNGSGAPAWLAGIPYSVDAPVEARPATLKAQFRNGPVPVHLTSTARFKVVEGDDKAYTKLQNLDSELVEQMKGQTPNGGAQMQLTVRKFATGVSKNNEKVATTPAWQKATSQDIGAMALDHDLDGQGNLTKKAVNYTRAIAPDSKTELDPIGKQLNQSFDIVSLPQPGNLMQPGQTWKGKRELPTPLELDILPVIPIDVTYVYRGTRQYKGKQVAVVSLSAVLNLTKDLTSRGPRGRPSTSAGTITLNGKISGTVLVDTATGMIVFGKALTDTTLILKQRGEDTQSVTGTLDIRLERGN